MITNSFRLKIALLSGAISCALLLLVGGLFWQLTYRMDLARVDRELRNLGHPQLERVNGGDHWVRFESALGIVGGTNQQMSFLLWVRHEDRELHRSAHWPAQIDPEAFPPLVDYEPPFVLAAGETPPPPPRRNEQISARNPALPRKEPQFYSRTVGDQTWRFAVMGNPYMTLILGANLGEFTAGMTQLRNTYLAAMPVVLLLVAAGAWWLASRALRPVTTLTQTVEGITARGLDQRIPMLTYDREMTRLITVFNQMMDRLERSFHQANRFSADAAHELKTPLTILQGELEHALNSAEPGSEQQRVYGDLLEEIQRLKSITQKLLLLAKADAGQLALELQPMNLSDAVLELVEDARDLNESLGIEHAVQPGVQVKADADLLQQVLQNLLSNAAKYNHREGTIRFELTANATYASLRVGNTGPGIPEAARGRIFERFFRAEPSRNREIGGAGLGLSLSRELVRAHGGELELEPAANGWTWFHLRLPLA